MDEQQEREWARLALDSHLAALLQHARSEVMAEWLVTIPDDGIRREQLWQELQGVERVERILRRLEDDKTIREARGQVD